MKNLHMEDPTGIKLALPVPADTPSGSVTRVGALTVLTTTVRVTQAMLDDFDKPTPQGLADGEASCHVIGCQVSIWVDVVGAIDAGDPIYQLANGTYSGSNDAAEMPVGVALGTLAASGKVPMALMPAPLVAGII